MKYNDAVRLLRQHGGELESQQDTLLGNLRPYKGPNNIQFSEIVQALTAFLHALIRHLRIAILFSHFGA